MRKPPALEIVIPLAAAASILFILPQKSAYLDTALAGLNWIESHAVEVTGGGSVYPNVPDEPDSPTTDISLYHGQPGRVHAFLQAAMASEDPKWEAAARRSLDGLEEGLAQFAETGYRDAGLYTGLAGVAAACFQASRVLPDGEHYLDRGLALADTIASWSRPVDGGTTWTGVTDMISGAAGSGLLLFEAFEMGGHRAHLDRALAAARWLLDVTSTGRSLTQAVSTTRTSPTVPPEWLSSSGERPGTQQPPIWMRMPSGSRPPGRQGSRGWKPTVKRRGVWSSITRVTVWACNTTAGAMVRPAQDASGCRRVSWHQP